MKRLFKFIFLVTTAFLIVGCSTSSKNEVQIIPESQELRSSVKNKIRDETAKFRDCYSLSVSNDAPNPTGKLILRILVSKVGKVTDVRRDDKTSTFNNEKVLECFKKVISGITFPVNSAGKESEIIFPFVFHGK